MPRISYKENVTNEEVRAKIGEEDKADRGRDGKTTSGNGQAWSSSSPREQWRTGENGENWLRNYLWSPNDPRGSEIDEMRQRGLHFVIQSFI